MPRIIPLLFLLLLVSCAANHEGPEVASPAEPSVQLESAMPGLPVGLDLPDFPPPEGTLRGASAGGSIKRLADQFSEKSQNAFYQNAEAYMLLESQPGESSWATYSFNIGALADVTMALARRVQNEAGQLYMGVANYETERWEWYSFATAQEEGHPFQLLDNSGQRYNSPLGNAHIALLTYDGFNIGIEDVELYTTNPPDPPGWIHASDGTQYDRIIITWPNDDSAELYEIEYKLETDAADEWVILDSVFPTATPEQVYIHSDINPPSHEAMFGLIYQYRVRSVYTGGGTSQSWSPLDTGFRTAIPPVITEIGYRMPGSGIEFEWEYPSGIDVCNIYRDGVRIEQDFSGDDYKDNDPAVEDGQEHVYTLQAVVTEGTSGQSEPATGRKLLWDMSLALATPDYTKRELAITILDGNLPFAAFINSVGQVGFAWATVPYPAGQQDWQIGTIFGPETGEIDEHYGLSLLNIAGVPYVFFCEELDEYNVYCASPNSSPAADADDWDVHKVWEQPFYLTGSSASMINGKAHVLITGLEVDMDPNNSFLFRSAVLFPDETVDWSHVPVAMDPNGTGAGLMEVASLPSFISYTDNLRFNVATSGEPGGTADFTSHYIGDQGFVGATFGFDFSTAVVLGTPSFAYKRSNSLVFAFPLTFHPMQETDWFFARPGFSLLHGSETSLVGYRGRPLMTCYSEDAKQIFIVSARDDFPIDGAANWYTGAPRDPGVEYGMSNAMTLQDGLPVVISTVEGAIPGELQFYRGY